jgi:hypothetical protein
MTTPGSELNVPLADLGSMMLWAARRTALLPNMAFIRHFPGALTQEELEGEARRIASNPYGLGRRLVMPKVPGARPLWHVDSKPPRVVVSPEALDASALSTWFADELSVRLDPLDGPGWRIGAIQAGGSTVVIVSMSHLYGTGRDIIIALAQDEWVPSMNGNGNGAHAGATNGDRPHAPAGNGSAADSFSHDLPAEANDLLRRLRLGFGGFARLGSQIVTSPQRREPHGDTATLRKPLDALMDRDPSRGKPSTRRVAALATVDAEAWAAAAAERSGSSLSLQVAVTANLLREARRGRGGPTHRPLRIIIPVDLADRSGPAAPDATLGPVELTSAGIVLSGGLASHGDLTEVRDTCRQAISAARAEVAATGRVPVAPGMVDAMRLLPDAVTTRLVMRVHARFDGAVSGVGPVPEGMFHLGPHVASDVFLAGFPMGSDLSMTMAESGPSLTLSLMADPSRLGAGPSLRERLEVELDRWGVEAKVE